MLLHFNYYKVLKKKQLYTINCIQFCIFMAIISSNNTMIETDRMFHLRSYGKGELANLYLPQVSTGSACTTLNRWIDNYPGLRKALVKKGLVAGSRRYTPLQVKLIVDALGEP